MAKWARNRIIYFGAQQLTNIAQKATPTFNSESITGVTVVAATFGTKMANSDEYTFIYDGTGWTWNTADVDLTEYGITIEGTASKNDAIFIEYVKGGSPWEALGKDNDDLSKELSPSTETTQNVLGESTFSHSGFQPEVSIDPYNIDPSRKLYKWILDIAKNEKYAASECVGYFAEFTADGVNTERQVMVGTANVRQAWYIPQSMGGDTAGANIPTQISPFGPVSKYNVVYHIDTNEAEFTAVNEATGG